MARVKDATPTTTCIRRYKQLLVFLGKLHDALNMPMTAGQQRGALISVGRMLNNIVCVFTVGNEIADRVLDKLNALLMSISTNTLLTILREECSIIAMLREDIKRCIEGLEASLPRKALQAST